MREAEARSVMFAIIGQIPPREAGSVSPTSNLGESSPALQKNSVRNNPR